jgi:hypothetical protein
MALHTIQVPINKSAYVDRTNGNTNYGTLQYIRAGEYNDPTYLYIRYFSLFGWDTSLIPTGKKIVTAILYLYSLKAYTRSSGGSLRHIYNTGAWAENTVTFNNAPIYTSFFYGSPYDYTGNIAANTYFTYTINPETVFMPNGITLAIDGTDYAEFNSSRATSNKPYLEVTYEDVPPDAPTPKTPIGIYKDSSAAIRFEWNYNSTVGGTQKKFDLQWSADQLNWTTVSQTTANNYYDMATNTLPAGNVYWRVRCYNEYDEVGGYCDIQSFYAIGAPAAPTINPIQTNSARPVVSWSAFDQQVYQLQVLAGDTVAYDSGDCPSISIRQHKVMSWLADGAYTVKLRIKNQYGLWSEWGQTSVTIATVKPAKPAFSITKTQYGLRAKASLKDADYALLYRDGLCVKKQTTFSTGDNIVRNGNGEEGTAWWVTETYASVSVNPTGGFIYTSSGASYIYMYQKISVKPNTQYYFNVVVTDIDAVYIYNDNFAGMLKAGVGTFNTGANNNVIIVFARLTAGSGTISEVHVVEGTTAPLAYKSYMEDYIVDDNAVVNGSEHEYKARAVIEGDADAYNDSDPVSETATFKGALIAPVSNLSNIFAFTRSLNSPPKRVYDRAPGGAMVQYAGRKYPVWEPNEHMSAGLSCGAFVLKTWAEVETFTAIYDLNGAVIYRDAKGRKIFGTLSNLQITDDRAGYIISFAINQVDYNEELEV